MSLHFTYTDKFILYHLNKGILPVLQLLSLPLRLNNTTKYKFLLLHAAKHTSYVAFKQWLLPFRYPLSPLFLTENKGGKNFILIYTCIQNTVNFKATLDRHHSMISAECP